MGLAAGVRAAAGWERAWVPGPTQTSLLCPVPSPLLLLSRCCRSRQAAAADAAPPRPNPRFSRRDLRRIKTEGPTVEDLRAHFDVPGRDKEGRAITNTYDFVPPEVLGDVTYAPEPAWAALPRMPYMEFYQGLRRRNWTSPHYDAGAEPWDVHFFRDSGRFMRPSFAGYRALVTRPDGSQAWAELDRPGADTFLRDYSGGGSRGAIHGAKRESQALATPAQYGYNQAFQQLFQAYERRLPRRGEREFRERGWVDGRRAGYDCPADALLDVSFHMTPSVRASSGGSVQCRAQRGGFAARAALRDTRMGCSSLLHPRVLLTRMCSASPPPSPLPPPPLPPPSPLPQELSLHGVWENLPAALFYAFGVSFLGISLAIGIFRPKKQMPMDMFQVQPWGFVLVLPVLV